MTHDHFTNGATYTIITTNGGQVTGPVEAHPGLIIVSTPHGKVPIDLLRVESARKS